MLFQGVPISSSQVGLCTETWVVQRSIKIVHGGMDCAKKHQIVSGDTGVCAQGHEGSLGDDARGAEGTGVSAASVRTDSGVD